MRASSLLLLVFAMPVLAAAIASGENGDNLTSTDGGESPALVPPAGDAGEGGWDWYALILVVAALFAIIGHITGFLKWIQKIIQKKFLKKGEEELPTFQIPGPVIIHPSPKPQVPPLQKPPRAEHFVGRDEELSSLLKNLEPGRVFTLSGPGGIGKTALAAEAIWTIAPGNKPPARFPDGIIFHTFYGRPQAALALEHIARSFGEDPRPTPAEAARRALSGRSALLVLDGAENADDLGAVLEVAGGCGVLVTSRKSSDAHADSTDLPPLPLEKAVQLLSAWGGKYASDEEAATEICKLLGGLPLAVFLAGRYISHHGQLAAEYLAWLRKTPLDALNLGDRQRESIPLLMERSLEKVSMQSRASLGIAGVLAFLPFDSKLIAIALEIREDEAKRGLGELVDYGILQRPEIRYHVTHALIHTYARERLPPAKEALARLAEHYNAFAREKSAFGPPGFAELDSHRGHILAVQTACLKAGENAAVRKLTWAIDGYLDLQGHWTERVAAVEMGLLAAKADSSRYDEGAFLGLMGLVYAALGDARKAIEHHEQALVISREIGDRRGEGNRLGNLGLAYADLGEPRKAIEHYESALKIAREIGDRKNEGAYLGNLGLAYADLGDLRKAIEHHEQALLISREIGDRRGEGNRLGNLGLAYARLGDARKAIEHYDQALLIAREIGDRRGEGNRLGNLGSAYFRLGDWRRAEEFYKSQLAIAQEIGDRSGEANALWGLAICSEKDGDLKQAISNAEEAMRIFEEIESPSAQNMRSLLAGWKGD